MKKFILVIALVLVIFGIISAFLPSSYEVERERMVDASASEVFAVLTDLRTWPEWTAWNVERDPDAVFEYDGEGEGAVMSWDGPALGLGRLELTQLEPDRSLSYHLSLQDGSAASEGQIRLEQSGSQTRVVWTQTGKLSNLQMRWFGLFLTGWLGSDFDTGLDGLEQHLAPEA